MNEIKYKDIFIDSTKIEANANRYTFVWKKATKKFEYKLQDKIRETLKSLNSDFDFKIPESKIEVYLLNDVATKLNEVKENNNI